jgi:hypothetical protein
MRSSITIRMRAGDADVGLMTRSAGRAGRFGCHQIAEQPPISVIVTEHRTNKLRCARGDPSKGYVVDGRPGEYGRLRVERRFEVVIPEMTGDEDVVRIERLHYPQRSVRRRRGR